MIEGTPTAAEARFPQVRMRRLRSGATIRRMVRETRLSPDRLVLPLFAIAGRDASVPIDSLPGHARLSPDLLAATARRAWDHGVPSVLQFGVTDAKDAAGSAAYETGGVVQTANAAVTRTSRPSPPTRSTCGRTCSWSSSSPRWP